MAKLKENFELEKQIFTKEQEKLQNNFKESVKNYENQIKELRKKVISIFYALEKYIH